MLLIAVALVLISVTVCLRQRYKRILITSSNAGLYYYQWWTVNEQAGHQPRNTLVRMWLTGAAATLHNVILELSANLAYTGRLEVKNIRGLNLAVLEGEFVMAGI